MTSGRASLPWSFAEARTALLATVGGAALLGWAWWQASGTGNTSRVREIDALSGAGMGNQATYAVIGVIAVMVIGAASISWVVAGRSAVRHRRDALLDELASALVPRTLGALDSSAEAHVVVLGPRRFHRSTCVLVDGKQLPRSADAGATEGLRACEVCQP